MLDPKRNQFPAEPPNAKGNNLVRLLLLNFLFIQYCLRTQSINVLTYTFQIFFALQNCLKAFHSPEMQNLLDQMIAYIFVTKKNSHHQQTLPKIVSLRVSLRSNFYASSLAKGDHMLLFS